MTTSATLQLEALFLTWFSRRRWNEADYLLFANDQNALIELSDGKVMLHEMPTPRHQGQVYVAPMPVRLRPGKMREPDVTFFQSEHMDRVHDQYTDPPDLVVEVLSPSTRTVDEVEKLSEYAAAGIPEYWVVDAEAGVVDVFVLAEDDYAPARRYAHGTALSPGPAPDVWV